MQPWPQGWLPETLLGLGVVEGRHSPPQHVDSPTIVAQAIRGLTEHEIRHDLEADVPGGGGEVQDAVPVARACSKSLIRPQIVGEQ